MTYKSWQELDLMVAKLKADLPAKADLPGMVAACGDQDDFDFCAFAGQAEAIEDSAAPADREYVHDQIQCVLGSAGLIPSDSEGQPCGHDSIGGSDTARRR